MHRWPVDRGRAYNKALRVCLQVLDDNGDPSEAREAFLDAAKEADVSTRRSLRYSVKRPERKPYALYPHMTVEQNLTYSLRIKGVKKAEAKKAAEEVAAITGLSDLLHLFPRELSGGQRQRVAMSRAIIRHPKAFPVR